ncbi:response regulator transcription factor [Salmonella enterica subsp. enterica serovar Urbana]|nr:response regulator transcription factor [Salmonella enterica subsp. enterica serovar Urbana]
MIEKSVKSLNCDTKPLHSTLMIDADNYIIEYFSKFILNPLVLHTSKTFREAKDKVENYIIDHIVMEVFTLEDSSLEALNFIYHMQINYPGIRLTILTFTRNRYLLQVLRSFRHINIVSKLESMSELSHAVDACWYEETFYSKYINDLMYEIEPPDCFESIEWTVLIELAKSTPKNDIAKIINKSYHSLFYYIKKINKKLHLSSKNEHVEMLKAININPLKSAQIFCRDQFR